MKLSYILTSCSGGDVIKRYFLYTALVALLLSRAEIFGHNEEQFCEIAMNLDQ